MQEASKTAESLNTSRPAIAGATSLPGKQQCPKGPRADG